MKTRKFNNSWVAKGAGCILTLTLMLSYNISRAQQKSTGNEVFTSVEHTPEFPGGMEAFYQYLGKNIRYPAPARDKNITGRVIVTFIVEKDGSLSDVKAVRSPDQSLANEAKRVIAASPKWKPGTQNNHVVRVQYTVPVQFSIIKNDGKEPKSEKGQPTNKVGSTKNKTTTDEVVVVSYKN
ncbi:energy transducer TonB [Mucilaginibacter sp. Bleaf8]|uniref:energy transducer TonB n=1 Tax=Mucilaginibacter sp. Bleaf8 TaxID=2834430 RepID=UPI001BCDF0B0|nr:energy transducer TonB [Mucilaginibacter sp. Bleaf8]MBS7566621.1 energy transducer TonB [Mucilaginibacter sp. Bleaf8]